ncbi:MAG: glycosyltransferase family 39 protein [Armatimonadota bacterium]|nr:MAG: glycosyltransferase family 39 protein [Armatimonadota bacterium]
MPAPQREGVTRVLAFIAVAYVIIAAAYALTIPFGRAPDESAHLPYVAYLADREGLPVFRAGEGSYEYHQAPLYYAAAVPAYYAGRALAPGREYVAVRLFGILLGLCVVYFTYRLAREFCPRRPWLAVGSAGFVAFLPMHVALSASVTNDVAAEVPIAAGLWLLLVGLRDGWTWRRVAAVGVLCGLAVLTKSSGLVLLPAAWLALVLTSRDDGFGRFAERWAALTAAFLLICGWWLVRNWQLYGDPLAWRAFLLAFQDRPHPSDLIGENLTAFNYALWVTGWTFASFWGVFGNMKVFLPTWGVYMPLAVLTAAALAGASAEAEGVRQWDSWRRRAAWVLLAAAALVVASFVRFNLAFFQAQGRYLFLALPVTAIIMTSGWGRLFPEGGRAAAYAALWLALMALSALALPVWILPALSG